MKRYLIAAAAMLGMSVAAHADSVIFYENFNGDYTENFPTILELDHLQPASNINSIFMNGEGVSMPWWHVKDSSASNDRFLASHAVYATGGKSNDWAVTRAIEIPTTGYVLDFDAQSVAFRLGEQYWLSSLHVFVSRFSIDAEYQPEPEEAELIINPVPYGNDYEAAEGDFLHYSINLDKYAGKKVWIAFANLNEDKDILCIDNVVVSRKDDVNLTAELPGMVVGGENKFSVNVNADTAMNNWKLQFTDDSNNVIAEYSDATMAAGTNRNFDITWDVPADKTSKWTATFTADGILPVTRSGEITALTYEPYHRVLVEEATGMWCSNCPLGMYNMEAISEHELTKDYVIPVSVHITGGMDELVNINYAGMLNLQAAPSYRVDRELVARYFSLSHDTQFDPTREGSMGALVHARHNELTTLEIDMKAEPDNAEKPTQIKCTTTINPALTMDASKLRIGFILKENNVHGNGSIYMAQENGTSGNQIEGYLGGWTLLPHKVLDVKYHDVARGIMDYNGIENSVPAKLEAGKEVNFSYTVPIPDTYATMDYKGEPMVTNPAVVFDNLVVVAFVVDLNTMRVLNSVQVPMSPTALEKDNEWLKVGVEPVIEGVENANAPVMYYDMQGRRIENPAKGMYIRVQGTKAEKVMIK